MDMFDPSPAVDATPAPESLDAEVVAIPNEAVDPPALNTAADLIEEMFDLTVDGEVEKVTKAELIRRASHASGAAKRMTEAQREKAAALRLSELLKQDPIRAAKELNKDFDERDFLTKRLAELMDEDMMSPEEKEQRAEMEELRQFREERRLAKEKIEQEELDRLVDTQRGELDIEIAEAMKTAGLPKTRSAVKRLANYMLDASDHGITVSTAKLAQQVKNDMKAELAELLNQSDDDAFEALLGSDLISKAQKLSLKKMKQPGERVDPAIRKKVDPEAPVTKRKSKEETLAALGYKDVLF